MGRWTFSKSKMEEEKCARKGNWQNQDGEQEACAGKTSE